MRCTVEYVKYENWHKDIAYTFWKPFSIPKLILFDSIEIKIKPWSIILSAAQSTWVRFHLWFSLGRSWLKGKVKGKVVPVLN
jgi:hypothetical protein